VSDVKATQSPAEAKGPGMQARLWVHPNELGVRVSRE
jgi:hypothetical protein